MQKERPTALRRRTFCFLVWWVNCIFGKNNPNMRFLFISFCLFCTLPLLAQQNCYDDLRRRGLRLLEQRQYDQAIDIFFRARYCPDAKSTDIGTLDDLIKRTQTAWVKELDDARQAAQDALEKLEAATAQTVELFCREIDQHILKLEYEQAAEKVAIANTLSANNPEVLQRLQEVAFFYTETNQFAKADSTLQLINQASTALERPILLEKINNLDTAYYDALQRRYYPEMVFIESGTFMMGSERDSSEQPVHEVTVPSFKMARTETTVWQYSLFAIASDRGLPDPPGWGWTGNNPMVNVSWYDAITYANWLSQRQGQQEVYASALEISGSVLINEQADGFRLPSEAEWEFAARGGNPEKDKNFTYAGSNNLDSVGWYGENSKSRTQPVAQLKPNGLELYDMSGNVYEWVQDCWNNSYQGAPTDGSAWTSGDCKRIVLRGGSWNNFDNNCRVAYR